MADDVSIDPGTTPSVPVAADDIAGVKYQRVKAVWGADGVVNDTSAANPIPVTDAALAATLTAIDAGIPVALGANGGMKVEGVAGGVAMPISGSISVTGTMPVDSSKVEDAVHASGDVGAFMLAVRNDAGGALAGTTGDYIPLTTDAAGLLRTTGGGTQFAEDAAHTTGDLGTMALGVRKDTATALSGTDGDYTPLITDASGRQHVNVGTSALPTGAATAAKQPALGTAGSASTDVLTVQGIASGTAIPVSSTAVRATTGAAPTAFTSTTSAVVFSSNVNRKLFTVTNDSDKDLYLMMAAAAASTTSYHVKVKASGGFFSTTDYTGEIRGIMSAAIGTGQVNPGEFT